MTHRRSLLFLPLLIAACGQPAPSNAAAADTAPATRVTPASTPVAEAPATPNRAGRHDGVHQVLRDVLVSGGQVDGQPITAVTAPAPCVTRFATAAGQTVIDWRQVADIQSRIEAGRVVIPVAAGATRVALSVPEGHRPEPIGNAADRMEMAFGTLVDDCAAG